MSSDNLIDLLKTDENGEFPCPKCGALISPEDETDEVYSIIDTKIEGNALKEIKILCRCGAMLGLSLQ